MGASMLTVPGASSAGCPAVSSCVTVMGAGTWDATTGVEGRPRTTRTRRPMLSISSSVRSWATASSTICWGVHETPAEGGRARAFRATGLARRRHAAQVVPAPGVDLHDVTLVEEERHLDHRSRLEGGRLVAAGGRVAADARVGLHDLELEEVGQLHGDGAAIDEQDVDLRVLLEEVAGIAHLVGGQGDLIVGLQVHEVIALVLVQVLHVLLLEVHQLDLLPRAEGVVDDPSLPHVLELGAHEGAALAGLDVLEVDDAVGLPVELDLQALLELRRGDLHSVMFPFVSGSWLAVPRRGAHEPACRLGACDSGEGKSRSRRRSIPAAGRACPCSPSRRCRQRGRG